jgi:NADH-quinone oxidoreductase subunit H
VPYAETWGLPALWLSILQVLAFVAKVAAMLIFYMWIRWTIPRFRYDQLMNLGWKVMLPLALANVVITGVWLWWIGH